MRTIRGLTCRFAHDGRGEAHEHVHGSVGDLHRALRWEELYAVFWLVGAALWNVLALLAFEASKSIFVTHFEL